MSPKATARCLPGRLPSRQDRIENGEQRWQTIGLVADCVLLLVAHTWVDEDDGTEHIRVVSARRATKIERKVYEQSTWFGS